MSETGREETWRVVETEAPGYFKGTEPEKLYGVYAGTTWIATTSNRQRAEAIVALQARAEAAERDLNTARLQRDALTIELRAAEREREAKPECDCPASLYGFRHADTCPAGAVMLRREREEARASERAMAEEWRKAEAQATALREALEELVALLMVSAVRVHGVNEWATKHAAVLAVARGPQEGAHDGT